VAEVNNIVESFFSNVSFFDNTILAAVVVLLSSGVVQGLPANPSWVSLEAAEMPGASKLRLRFEGDVLGNFFECFVGLAENGDGDLARLVNVNPVSRSGKKFTQYSLSLATSICRMLLVFKVDKVEIIHDLLPSFGGSLLSLKLCMATVQQLKCQKKQQHH
jgi:hypothetical protein